MDEKLHLAETNKDILKNIKIKFKYLAVEGCIMLESSLEKDLVIFVETDLYTGVYDSNGFYVGEK